MDTIHDVDNKPWISRHKLNLKAQLDFREQQFGDKGLKISHTKDEVDTEYERLLESKLREFKNSNEKEVRPYFLFNTTDERALTENPHCKLRSYILQLEHAKQMVTDMAYKVSYMTRELKTTRREFLMRHLAAMNRQPSDDARERPPVDKSLVAIVVVQIWRAPTRTNDAKFQKEVLFRSDQCLTDLRDQIKCQRDYGVPMDLSDNPDEAERVFRGEIFKSAFFLIGNTFYNDLRDPNNTDLSADIVDWASKEVTVVNQAGENVKVSRGVGPFKRAKMEESRFEDLEFRLGCPYLYLHQGDCEHLFTISDIRYVTNDLKLAQTRYPFVTAATIGQKMANTYCYMCKSRPPHWYTRNNDRLPMDPFFFCENCFYSFNYDANKRKVGNFQAYLYTGPCGIPDSVVMPK